MFSLQITTTFTSKYFFRASHMIEIVKLLLPNIKGSKIGDSTQFGPKNHSWYQSHWFVILNTALAYLPSWQNGCHFFADDVFRCIFVNKKFCILIQISPKFVHNDPIDNTQYWLHNDLAIIWTNADPIHWRMHVELRWDELNLPNQTVYSSSRCFSYKSWCLHQKCGVTWPPWSLLKNTRPGKWRKHKIRISPNWSSIYHRSRIFPYKHIFLWEGMRRYYEGITRVSCQKGPIHHAYAWQIGPFWQDTLDYRQDITSIPHAHGKFV